MLLVNKFLSSNFRVDFCRRLSGSATVGGRKQIFGQGTRLVVKPSKCSLVKYTPFLPVSLHNIQDGEIYLVLKIKKNCGGEELKAECKSQDKYSVVLGSLF